MHSRPKAPAVARLDWHPLLAAIEAEPGVWAMIDPGSRRAHGSATCAGWMARLHDMEAPAFILGA